MGIVLCLTEKISEILLLNNIPPQYYSFKEQLDIHKNFYLCKRYATSRSLYCQVL